MCVKGLAQCLEHMKKKSDYTKNGSSKPVVATCSIQGVSTPKRTFMHTATDIKHCDSL